MREASQLLGAHVVNHVDEGVLCAGTHTESFSVEFLHFVPSLVQLVLQKLGALLLAETLGACHHHGEVGTDGLDR